MPIRLPGKSVLSTLIIVVIVAGIACAGTYWRTRAETPPESRDSGEVTGSDQPAMNTASPSESGAGVVVLPASKLASAAIQIEVVGRTTLTHTHSVPGRVAYNDTRHVEVTAPTSGILTDVLVKPGDIVEAGQVLALLNSSEIGAARADVLQRQAEVELTRTLAERAATFERNVVSLTSALKQNPEFEVLQKQHAGKVLGNYRDELFGAYSRLHLAESILKNTASLAESGALSGIVMQEREATARSARAKLEAACEQTVLEVSTQRRQADANALNAQRRLQVSRQLLGALLLSEAAIHMDQDMLETEQLGASDQDLKHLSRVAVRAPFGGTIESRTFSASERVQATDSMFVLADTTTLWITAEIRENDWPAVSMLTGQTLTVTVPALGSSRFDATVEFIGREVSIDTNAIPIVARINNADGRLRPGLFARVTVPVGVKSNVLTVEKRAVLQHDSQSFVFVADAADRFRRVKVQTGENGEDRVEIVSGLNVGDRVVTHGAFILKSELLLEGEGE
ncbi:MAG: efflux RND transporter periplasmic adaptor subunit [Rhodopirellula sp.]|nr:efflux RND transporter periplasmic adaptor subunit [Rhodopirellula sp.]